MRFLRANPSRDRRLDIKIGAPAWGRKEWVGKIYPEKTPATQFLHWYSRYFSCVELNTTHYRIPSDHQVSTWKSLAAEGFIFCPKVYQGISHERTGLLDRSLLASWHHFVDALAEKAGPSFLQLPPYFDYSMKAQLFSFLKSWPDAHRLALEFRHPSWFENGKIIPALTSYLQTRGIGLVITDVAGRRDVLHTSISSDFVMLRFIGNNLHPSDQSRAQQWTDRFSKWQSAGLSALYLFVHEPDDLTTPEMTEIFLQHLRAAGWDLRSSQTGGLASSPPSQLPFV